MSAAIDTTKPMYGFEPPTAPARGKIIALCDLNRPTASIDEGSLFRRLAEEWKTDTSHLSLISQRIRHDSYRRILRMAGAVDLILAEIEREPDHWFHALMLLTGENPVPRNFDGTVTEAAKLWVDWGKRKHATQGTEKSVP